jgi:UDP-2-acetamido-2-deoxy-ribo-hexuluronate aminotransferase
MEASQNIQMVDLAGQYQRLKPDIDRAVAKVLAQSHFINGPEVQVFSDALGEYLDVKHVIPCGNGTDALQAALMALDLQAGDEVITTTFSFVATVEVIALLGLIPVLVDPDPDTYNIDPERVKEAITNRTRAIIPVHLFGQSAAMDEIMHIAEEHRLYVVEDAAQSIGGTFRMNGRSQKLGTIGDIGCTSFFPSKNLGCFGDGGACFTNNDELAEKLRMIMNHGARRKYCNELIGMNSRLDTIQAGILLGKLKHLDDFLERRQRAATFYFNELKDLPFIRLPRVAERGEHSFNLFTVRVMNDMRDDLKKYLSEAGVPAMVYYPSPLHRQPAFSRFCKNGITFPVAEMLSEQVLSLPMHTELTKEQQRYITDKIRRFL